MLRWQVRGKAIDGTDQILGSVDAGTVQDATRLANQKWPDSGPYLTLGVRIEDQEADHVAGR